MNQPLCDEMNKVMKDHFEKSKSEETEIEEAVVLLKSAMDSLSRRCDAEERGAALYDINSVIENLESIAQRK